MRVTRYLPVCTLSYFDLAVFAILQGNIQRSQLVVEQLGDSRKSMVKVSFGLFCGRQTLREFFKTNKGTIPLERRLQKLFRKTRKKGVARHPPLPPLNSPLIVVCV